MPNSKICAAILAGGKSSRFSSGDKALAMWGNKTIIETEIEILKKIFEYVFIISNYSDAYKGLGVEIFKDLYPFKGPLAGVHSALVNTKFDRVFIVGCDMPLLNKDFISWMKNINTWAPIVIPSLRNGLEPLHAIYHRSLAPIIENLLTRPQKTMGLQAFINLLPYMQIKEEKIKLFCPKLLCLKGINTKEEFEMLKKSMILEN